MVLKLPNELEQKIKTAQILICVVSLPTFEKGYDTDQ